MKKVLIGLIIGIVIAVAGSVLSASFVQPTTTLGEQKKVEIFSAGTPNPPKSEVVIRKPSVPVENKKVELTLEQRLQDIEARLEALENK